MLTTQFTITKRCNLDCSFCYVTHEDTDMTVGVFDTLYEDVKARNEEYTFDFFGGEPLLNWELVQHAVPLLKQDPLCKKIRLFSNGLLLTEDIVSYLVDNTVEFTLSHQEPWPPELLPLIHKLTNRATVMVTPENINSFPYTYLEFLDRYQLIADFRLLREPVWTSEDVYRFSVEYPRLCEHYVKRLRDTRQNCIPKIISYYLYKMINGLLQYKQKQYCGAGDSIVCYNPDGNTYPCERYANENTKSPDNFMTVMDQCNSCQWGKVCERGCLHQRLLHGTNENLCKMYGVIYTNIAWLAEELKDDSIWIDYISGMVQDGRQKDNGREHRRQTQSYDAGC